MRLCTDSVFVVVAWLLLGSGHLQRVGHAELVYDYNDIFEQAIPADSSATKGWMEDAIIEVPDHLIIDDLDISLSLTHTSVFDLQLFLTSPSGTTVLLNSYDPFIDYFTGEDYQQTVFDDEAPVSIADAAPPFSGSFRPRSSGALSAFDGEDAFGSWRLQIYDAYDADAGSLNAFGLSITTPEPATAAFLLVGLGVIGMTRPRRS